MREIKFRAWENNLKEIIAVEEIEFLTRMINQSSAWRVFDEVELMQFTGLKDKNGTDIYEGDILSTDLSRPYLIVEFRNGAFMYQCHHDGQNYYDFMESAYENLNFTKYHEVIGNIYEHPELLERSNKGGQVNERLRPCRNII